jgi:hypothetical protein
MPLTLALGFPSVRATAFEQNEPGRVLLPPRLVRVLSFPISGTYSSNTLCFICMTCGTPLSWNHLMASTPSSARCERSLDEAE